MALPDVRHGSRRKPSWLCEKSIMALGGIRHLWRLSSAFTGQSAEVTDFSQSHDGFLTEPLRTPPRAVRNPVRAMTDVSQNPPRLSFRISKTKKKS